LSEVEETIAQVRREIAAKGVSGPHLITVGELRAVGALDVPAAWRKSLGDEPRYLLSGFEDDDPDAESQQVAQSDCERKWIRPRELTDSTEGRIRIGRI
jgi:hypothetical protein